MGTGRHPKPEFDLFGGLNQALGPLASQLTFHGPLADRVLLSEGIQKKAAQAEMVSAGDDGKEAFKLAQGMNACASSRRHGACNRQPEEHRSRGQIESRGVVLFHVSSLSAEKTEKPKIFMARARAADSL